MQTTLNIIEKKALQLSKKDRGFLAEKLLRSIGDNSLTEIDELWVKEAEKRYNNYLAGKTKGIEGDKIFADIKQELGN